MSQQSGVAPAARTGSTASSVRSAGSSSKLTVGSRCTIAQEADIRGRVHIGSGSVVHPRAVIHALDDDGDIVIGEDCIVEELTQIVHAGKGTMHIGNSNLFEVGCRVEARSIASHNTFECKSRVLDSIAVPDFCTVGVGCTAQPPTEWLLVDAGSEEEGAANEGTQDTDGVYTLPPRTIIFGQDTWRQWSGHGVKQADALHVKHLDHLRRNLPEAHKLRVIT